MSNTGYKYIYKTANGKYQIKIWNGSKNQCFKVLDTLEEAVKHREECLKELGIKLCLDK